MNARPAADRDAAIVLNLERGARHAVFVRLAVRTVRRGIGLDSFELFHFAARLAEQADDALAGRHRYYPHECMRCRLNMKCFDCIPF